MISKGRSIEAPEDLVVAVLAARQDFRSSPR